MADQKTESLIIRVTPELKAQLQQLANQDRRTLSDYVRLLIERTVSVNPKP